MDTITATSKAFFPPLLSIPVELRYQIYSYLCDPSFFCYPYPNSPITSISLRAPPRQLLLTCHQISEEVRSHFYGLATFRFSSIGTEPLDVGTLSLGTLSALREVRRAELRIFWNLLGRRMANKDSWPWSMSGWLPEMVHLLNEKCAKLEVVVVSSRGVSGADDTDGWEAKRGILEPLEGLSGRGVRFEVGRLEGSRGAVNEEEVDREKIEELVARLNG